MVQENESSDDGQLLVLVFVLTRFCFCCCWRWCDGHDTGRRRGYSFEAYVDLAHRARNIIPDLALSSDFIAGFCGETEEDHKATLALLNEVRVQQQTDSPSFTKQKLAGATVLFWLIAAARFDLFLFFSCSTLLTCMYVREHIDCRWRMSRRFFSPTRSVQRLQHIDGR